MMVRWLLQFQQMWTLYPTQMPNLFPNQNKVMAVSLNVSRTFCRTVDLMGAPLTLLWDKTQFKIIEFQQTLTFLVKCFISGKRQT